MNNTCTVGASNSGSNQILYIIYILQGLVVSIGNLTIVVAIARYQALRSNKEYVLILGLSLADCVNMAGFFSAGVYRSLLLANGIHDTCNTAWKCLLTVQNMLWGLGMQLSALMLLAVALDRLLSVLFPLAYIGWTVSYARRLVSSFYIFNLLNLIYYFWSTYSNGRDAYVPATCMVIDIVRQSTNRYYFAYFNIAMPSYTVLSVVLYGVVMLVLQKRFNTIVFSEHPSQQHELKRQRKITVTLLISALCTLFLFVIPFSIGIVFFSFGQYTAALFLWCCGNLNPAANVLLYPLRHREMRQALGALFKGQTMPLDLKMWNPPTVQVEQIEMAPSQVRAYVPRSATVN